MNTDAEVIVAGAGPAGTMAAFLLASEGHRVLILEKASFPRYKVCGAGLTHKILTEIPFDLTPVLETTIHTFTFSRGFQEVFTRTNTNPLIYCTMRDKLDAFLLERAMAAGAKVYQGMRVTGLHQQDQFVEVLTKERSFTAQAVIGAEGASGTIARAAGLWRNIEPGLAWEAEISVDDDSLSRFAQTVFLDWGAFPGGYGWLFPKSGHFSIGVGGPASLSNHMPDYYRNFITFLRNQGVRNIEQRSLKSWPIPVKVRRGDFHTHRVLVAGDAAGLTDPLTGEGIYYAIMSGKLAAGTIRKFLSGHERDLSSYSQAVNRQLMPELTEANRIRAIFNVVPRRIHHFVRDHDRAWRAFGKVLRGERGYADVRNGFGRWKFLWGIAGAMAGRISSVREKRFKRNGFK